MKRLIFVIIALTAMAAADSARAILLTPPAKKGKFTFGAQEMWLHRDTEWTDGSGASEDQYNLGTFWAKYGFHERFTGYFEFVILNGDPHNEGTSYRHINLGVGATFKIVEFEDFYVSALANYFENFQHDNQESNCHSMTRHFAGLVQVGRTWELGTKHELTGWWGPAVFVDNQIYDGGACLGGTKESQNNLGMAAGTDFLFWSHLELFVHVLYANYLQPRIGVGYQF
jgi:hypothetical protein